MPLNKVTNIQLGKKKKGGTHPDVKPAGVWDVVVNVTVVSQTHDAKTNQGTHVQGEDGDEQGLHTLQVTVEENGHENNLQETKRDDERPTITGHKTEMKA